MSQVLVSIKNDIKTITLNNPSRKNALTPQTLRSLQEALEKSKTDGTKTIVLTGAGEDFCSGADLASIQKEVPDDVTTYVKEVVNPAIISLHYIQIPVIAKVKGICVGLGFNLVLACDMIIASEEAKFSQIFTNIGLSSDGGGSFFMARKVGYYKAFELMTLNTIFSAQEAAELGLVNKVFSKQTIDEAVHELTSKLSQGPLIAIKHTKANLTKGLESSLEETLDLEAENQGKNFITHDFAEGVKAFLEKRPPIFQGK